MKRSLSISLLLVTIYSGLLAGCAAQGNSNAYAASAASMSSNGMSGAQASSSMAAAGNMSEPTAGMPGQEAMPSTAQISAAGKTDLPNLGPAPELTNQVWLNTDHPLRLSELRGKVVLLEMWTFECINCQHTIPSMLDWNQKYSDQGLVIIGDHFPEFPYEANLNNLKEAVQKLKIPYAVAQDNDGVTWNAYHNLYWPTLYLIDKQGNIRYSHIGEGGYAETEAAIQALLRE